MHVYCMSCFVYCTSWNCWLQMIVSDIVENYRTEAGCVKLVRSIGKHWTMHNALKIIVCIQYMSGYVRVMMIRIMMRLYWWEFTECWRENTIKYYETRIYSGSTICDIFWAVPLKVIWHNIDYPFHTTAPEYHLSIRTNSKISGSSTMSALFT